MACHLCKVVGRHSRIRCGPKTTRLPNPLADTKSRTKVAHFIVSRRRLPLLSSAAHGGAYPQTRPPPLRSQQPEGQDGRQVAELETERKSREARPQQQLQSQQRAFSSAVLVAERVGDPSWLPPMYVLLEMFQPVPGSLHPRRSCHRFFHAATPVSAPLLMPCLKACLPLCPWRVSSSCLRLLHPFSSRQRPCSSPGSRRRRRLNSPAAS